MKNQDGIVMISLLVFLAMVSLAAAIEFPGLLEERDRKRQGEGEQRVQELARGAESTFRLTRKYPADLDALVLGGNYTWRDRKDPFAPSLDLVYQNRGDELELRSRGVDGRSSSADDVVERRSNRVPARALTRNRLRLLRARAYVSAYLSPSSLTAAERDEVRARLRTRSLLMRRRVYGTDADAQVLDKLIQDEEKELRKILKKHRKGKVYNQATGRKGLLSYLGLSDDQGVDGYGRDLLADDFGFHCAGRDGRRNSKDDF